LETKKDKGRGRIEARSKEKSSKKLRERGKKNRKGRKSSTNGDVIKAEGGNQVPAAPKTLEKSKENERNGRKNKGR